MRFLQLKISPPQGRRSVETELYDSLVTQAPRENFLMRFLQLEISPPQGRRSVETEL